MVNSNKMSSFKVTHDFKKYICLSSKTTYYSARNVTVIMTEPEDGLLHTMNQNGTYKITPTALKSLVKNTL